MTNPETGEQTCAGCGCDWKENSIFCGDCQKKNLGNVNAGLGALAARASLFTTVEKVLEDCHKCHKPNSVTKVGWFCGDCMHQMSYNSYLRRYTDGDA